METLTITAWLLWFMECCTLSAPPALLPRCPRDSPLPMVYPSCILPCTAAHWCSTPPEMFFVIFLSLPRAWWFPVQAANLRKRLSLFLKPSLHAHLQLSFVIRLLDTFKWRGANKTHTQITPTCGREKKHFHVPMWCTKLGENGGRQYPSYWDCEMYLKNVNKCSYSPPKLDSNEDSLEMAKTLEVSFAICTFTSSTIFYSFFPLWI